MNLNSLCYILCFFFKLQNGTCSLKSSSIASKVSTFSWVPSNNETALLLAVATRGPVATSIFVTNTFLFYQWVSKFISSFVMLTIDFVIEGRASTAIRPVKLTRSITPLSLSVTALTMEPITGSYAIRGDVHGAATAMFSFKEVLTCATLQLSLLFLISRKFILKYLKLSHYYSL